MLHSVVTNGILSLITPLSFAERVGGVVYPLQTKKIDKDGRAVIKTVPIYGNDPVTCGSDDYIMLTPDDRYKSVICFEATPETAIEEQSHQGQLSTSATLTLVAWFNLPRINEAFTAENAMTNCEAMMRNLIYAVQGTYAVGDAHCIIQARTVRYRDPAIFSRWTYDEAEHQYLIYPFDFGAVDFEATIIYPICDEEPTVDPDCYNT